MNKYFHEAKLAIENCRKEWTEVGSLHQIFAYTVNHVCETAVRGLWFSATNEEFPREKIGPYHKPLSQVQHVGIWDYYSTDSREFLGQINGMALDNVRYIESKTYEEYTKPKSSAKGKKLVAGAEKFIKQTIKLSENELAVARINQKNTELKKDSS